jgi:hypothetical protein
VSFKELPVSPGLAFNNRTPDSHWGKPEVIDALVKIGAVWASGSSVPISIGQISRKLGGKFPPHNTHKEGDDVDVRPMRKDGQNAKVTWRDSAYSRDLTRAMITTIRANAPIRSILFNDPELIKENLCQAYPDHSNHLHLNFGAFPVSRSTLRRGSTDAAAIRQLQEKLKIRIDGVYGSGTEGAVYKFQIAHGLKADGIAGVKTLAMLFGEKQ